MISYRFTDYPQADPIVKDYQEKLNFILRHYHGNWEYINPNGIFDIKTAYCVREFQKYRNITPCSGELNLFTMMCIDDMYRQITLSQVGLNKGCPHIEKPTLANNTLSLSNQQSKEWEITKKIKLSEHFTIGELCTTNTGLLNIPDDDIIFKLYKLCNQILEPIRKRWGAPIAVNSGYRCKAVNTKVGGATTSQHLSGEAADLKPSPNCTKGKQCSKYIKTVFFETILEMINMQEIQVGQLIWEWGTSNEPAWVHVSLPYKKINDVISIPKGRKIFKKNDKTGKIEIVNTQSQK